MKKEGTWGKKHLLTRERRTYWAFKEYVNLYTTNENQKYSKI